MKEALINSRYRIMARIGEGTFGKVYKALDYGLSPKAEVSLATTEVVATEKGKSILELDTANLDMLSMGEQSEVFSENKDPNYAKFRKEEAKQSMEKAKIVAIKKLRIIERQEDEQHFQNELILYHQLKHPNVIKLIDSFRGKQNLFFVFEYAETDLEKIISSKTVTLNISQIKCCMQQILGALSYTHSQGIMHRDIKPSNFLVYKNGSIKLTDFGIARSFKEAKHLTKMVCTRWYKAPEIIFGDPKYGPATDMWSAGCVLAEFLLRTPLFPGGSDIDQISRIIDVLGAPSEDNWKGVSNLPNFIPFEGGNSRPLKEIFFTFSTVPGLMNLLENLLCFDPQKRLTASEALSHFFFSSTPLPCPQKELISL